MKFKKITSITLICCLFSTLNLSNSFATEVESSYSGLGYINKWEEDVFRMNEGIDSASAEIIKDKLYVIGGNTHRKFLDKINIFDINKKKFIKSVTLPNFGYEISSTVIGDYIYIAGLNEKEKNQTNIVVYNTLTGSFEDNIRLPLKRNNYIIESIGDKLYLVGGFDYNHNRFKYIDIYDTKTKNWSKSKEISNLYSIKNISVLNDEIYLLGTTENEDEDYGDNVNIYNTTNDTWRKGSNTPSKRMDSASEVIREKIYLFGGISEDSSFGLSFPKDIEVYDPILDKWEIIGESKVLGAKLATTVKDDIIYIVGGWRYSLYSDRIDILKPFDADLDEAERLVIKAETSLSFKDISNARDKVNSLESSLSKDILQSRLDKLIPNDMTYEAETVTSNLDVYIKSKNMLVLSLDTNIVEFNDFSGIDDLEKENAITMKVSSSLPYDINVSLETEMTNQKGDKLDNSTLSIKSNNERNYLSFGEIKTPLTIIQDQPIGNDVSHNIDLKLNGGLANKSGTYKTSLKFEVIQK